MQLRFGDDHFAVFDDFLAAPDFAGVWRFVQAQRYKRAHERGWDPVWLLHDGSPLVSEAVHTGGAIAPSTSPEDLSPLHAYPTGTHVDRLLEELVFAADTLAPWIGRQGPDWSVVSVRAFLYPKETGLGWHTDTSATFVYYAHPHWESYWGGELLIARLLGSAGPTVRSQSPLDRRALYGALSELGSGEYLEPKPNRLVVLRAGTPHRINAVHPTAGGHLRGSIAGFFLRP
jgi:hypothetical protein